jgi:hypothetical protein
VNLVVFALLIEHAIEREPHFSGPHRLRPSLLGPLRIGALQQGHLGRLLASATMSRLRTVAIELGMCRSGRIGGASGSATLGNGRQGERRGEGSS